MTELGAHPFVCSGQARSTNATLNRNVAFFLQVQGDGVWCQDGEFFAEYFDSLDLSGNPLATQCEVQAPQWHWGKGVPPPLLGKTRSLAPELFSARWTARIGADERDDF